MVLAAVWTALQDTQTLLFASRDFIEGIKDYFNTLNTFMPEFIPKTQDIIIEPENADDSDDYESEDNGDVGSDAAAEEQRKIDDKAAFGFGTAKPQPIRRGKVAEPEDMADNTKQEVAAEELETQQADTKPPKVSLAVEVGITQTNVEIIESTTQDSKFLTLFQLSLPSAKLGMSGFCPTTLLLHGYFKLGQPEIGMVRFRNQVYAFAGIEEAKHFIREPKHMIEGVIKAAQNRLDWMQLLNLDEHELLAWVSCLSFPIR